MCNKNNSNGTNSFESWKSFVICVLLVSLGIFLFHIIDIVAIYFTRPMSGFISGIVICHMSFFIFLGCYIRCYNYFIETKIIEKSKKRFWLGLLPLIIGEILNIVVLICFLILH